MSVLIPVLAQTVCVEGHLGAPGKAGRVSEHYVKLVDNQVWVYKKQKDLAPVKYYDLKDATEVMRGGSMEIVIRFADEKSPVTFKAYSQDDYNLWGGAFNLQVKNAKGPTPQRKVIDVLFLDGSKLAMTIDTEATTAEDARWPSRLQFYFAPLPYFSCFARFSALDSLFG